MATSPTEKQLEDGVEIEVSKDQATKHANTHDKAIDRAKAATAKEHRMGLLEGIRTYPKAIGWSMLISLCIAMEAFDLCLLNTFCEFQANPEDMGTLADEEHVDGLPQFQEFYGKLHDDGTYVHPA
jgi:MFS transporter, SP family, general alpha glucoside:H+ symporter